MTDKSRIANEHEAVSAPPPSPASQPQVPDIYIDGVAINGAFNSVNVTCYRVHPALGQQLPVAVIRMSPQQAKVLGLLLTATVTDLERKAEVRLWIPPEVLAQIDAGPDSPSENDHAG